MRVLIVEDSDSDCPHDPGPHAGRVASRSAAPAPGARGIEGGARVEAARDPARYQPPGQYDGIQVCESSRRPDAQGDPGHHHQRDGRREVKRRGPRRWRHRLLRQALQPARLLREVESLHGAAWQLPGLAGRPSRREHARRECAAALRRRYGCRRIPRAASRRTTRMTGFCRSVYMQYPS